MSTAKIHHEQRARFNTATRGSVKVRCNLGQSKVLPDLEELRDRILKTWNVQRRAESKERIEEALDKFTKELRLQ